MKLLLTEDQYGELKTKIYDRFLDNLVRDTEIFGGMEYEYSSYKYVAHIKFPFSDNPYTMSFNNPKSYTFTSPGRYGLKSFFMLVGVDMDETPKKAEKLWEMYLDRLEVKVSNYIKEFLDDED